jgi:type I restriction enzyme S subunit
MSSEWREVRLGDLLDVTTGAGYKGADLEDLTAQDRLLSITAIAAGGGFKAGGLRPYSGRCRDPQRCRPGDVVIALTDLTQDGSMLGSPAVVPDLGRTLVASHHVARIHNLSPELSSAWLYYRLQTTDWRHRSASYATGTTVRQFKPAALEDWRVSVPPRGVQDVISSVLGTLDAKIRSNARLARLLEETAAVLFHRCIGRHVQQPKRELPARWSRVRLAQVVDLNPKVPIRRHAEVPFIEMAALEGFATRPGAVETRTYSSGARYERGDTLFARITPCTEHGKGAYVDFMDGAGAGSTEFIVMRAREPLTPEAVFLLSRNPRLRERALSNMIGTSGRQRVPVAALADIELAVPPSLDDWRETADAIAVAFRGSLSLWREAATLRELRDALLPHLVRGPRDCVVATTTDQRRRPAGSSDFRSPLETRKPPGERGLP